MYMGTKLVREPISTQQLREAGEELYGDMVKAVVDVEKEVMAVGTVSSSGLKTAPLETTSRNRMGMDPRGRVSRPIPCRRGRSAGPV